MKSMYCRTDSHAFFWTSGDTLENEPFDGLLCVCGKMIYRRRLVLDKAYGFIGVGFMESVKPEPVDLSPSKEK